MEDGCVLGRLAPGDAGEVLTLQRAAFVTEAQAHADPCLPPLTQTLAELRAELADPACHGWGIRAAGRLVACVRVRVAGDTAEVSRLVVAPDWQGEGMGTRLLLAAEESLPPEVRALTLFTGEHGHGNLRLYERLGYTRTHAVPAGAYQLIHLAKPRIVRDKKTEESSLRGAGDISLRSARVGDYDRIITVVDEWWGRPVQRALPRLFLDHFHDTSLVAERSGGELAGFLVGFRSQARRDCAYIQFVGVAPQARGSGLAAMMYRAFFAAAAEDGRSVVRAVTAPVNSASIAFHTALGFTVTGPVDGYDGPSAAKVLFEKRLGKLAAGA